MSHFETGFSFQKDINFFSELKPRVSEQNHCFSLDHSFLEQSIQLTHEFYSPSSEVTVPYLKKEASDVAQTISSVNGFQSVFFTGFPFYALNPDQTLINVSEIDSFLEKTKKLIIEDSIQNPSGWRCPSCQKENNLPDLKQICKPCDRVSLKPRIFFSALPDLDVTVLVDNPKNETEIELKKILGNLGYAQSDFDIYCSAIRTSNILAELKNGKTPEEKLLIDLHIWSKSDFDNCLKKMNLGETNIQIPTRSLHMDWEDDELNFWFDFVFSLTPSHIASSTLEKDINQTRKNFSARYSKSEIIEIIETMSPRAQRLIKCDEIKNILLQKIDSWK